MKKTLATLALAGSIALVGTAPAMAATYPILPPAASVSNGSVVAGQPFVFTAQGFLPGETVTITITVVTTGAANAGGAAVSAKIPVFQAPQTLSATADAQGKISVPLTINEPGTYSITATGNTSGVTVGPVTIKVVAALAQGAGAKTSSGSAAGLPNTGVDSGIVVWTIVGAGALAAGAASVVVVRRRAKSDVTAA